MSKEQTITIGNVRIVLPHENAKNTWNIGFGARVFVDGNEVKDLSSVTIRIAANEPISVTLNHPIRFPPQTETDEEFLKRIATESEELMKHG
jgi:hypothetical protein